MASVVAPPAESMASESAEPAELLPLPSVDDADGNALNDNEAVEDDLVGWLARTVPLGEWAGDADEYVPQRTLQFVSAPVFSTQPMQRYLKMPSVAV